MPSEFELALTCRDEWRTFKAPTDKKVDLYMSAFECGFNHVQCVDTANLTQTEGRALRSQFLLQRSPPYRRLHNKLRALAYLQRYNLDKRYVAMALGVKLEALDVYKEIADHWAKYSFV